MDGKITIEITENSLPVIEMQGKIGAREMSLVMQTLRPHFCGVYLPAKLREQKAMEADANERKKKELAIAEYQEKLATERNVSPKIETVDTISAVIDNANADE
jgi:hypothetical protein